MCTRGPLSQNRGEPTRLKCPHNVNPGTSGWADCILGSPCPSFFGSQQTGRPGGVPLFRPRAPLERRLVSGLCQTTQGSFLS